MRDDLLIPVKGKNAHAFQSNKSTLRWIPANVNSENVYVSITKSSDKLKTAQLSSNSWTGKGIVEYSYNGKIIKQQIKCLELCVLEWVNTKVLYTYKMSG